MSREFQPKGFTCTCGKEQTFPLYVYAKWDIPLVFTCDCGKKWDLLRGRATPAAPGPKPKRRRR